MGNVTLKMLTDVIGVEKTPKDVKQGWGMSSPQNHLVWPSKALRVS